jgi:hypothetical protein
LRDAELRAFLTAREAAARAPAAALETRRTAFFAAPPFVRVAVARAAFFLARAVSFRILDSCG